MYQDSLTGHLFFMHVLPKTPLISICWLLSNEIYFQVNDLGREKLQIESDLQQRSRLEKRKEELQDITEVLVVEIDECKVQLQPLQVSIVKSYLQP